MGQKVNPHGMRLGIVKTWDAKWYAGKDFAANLHEDIKIRSFLKETLKVAGVSKIETERSKNRLRLTIHTAKPGMVIYHTNYTLLTDPKSYTELNIVKE